LGQNLFIQQQTNKQTMALHCCGVNADGTLVVENFQDSLGKCSVGKSCVRFKRLSDLNQDAVKALIQEMATCDIMQ
jgi:hypothetical protein